MTTPGYPPSPVPCGCPDLACYCTGDVRVTADELARLRVGLGPLSPLVCQACRDGAHYRPPAWRLNRPVQDS